MTVKELRALLQSETLTLQQVKDAIYECKNDCIGRADITNKYECGFYNGEVNAFYICLDLLDKLEIK